MATLTSRVILLMHLIAIVVCCDNGDLRLVNGSSILRGRMEVCDNQMWRTVSDYGLDYEAIDGQRAASVACRQLGFSSQNATLIRGPGGPSDPNRVRGPSDLEPFFHEGIGPSLLQAVMCSGDERALIQCPYQTSGLDTGHAGVVCTSECTDGAVRLANGTNDEGRVEFCWSQAWSTLTATNFNPNTATVICQQLGLDREGARGIAGSQYGSGLGPVLSVQCTGSESSLTQCSVTDDGRNFDHSNDVAVACNTGGSGTAEPTTMEPTTVEPTTMEPTNAEPTTTVVETTSEPSTIIEGSGMNPGTMNGETTTKSQTTADISTDSGNTATVTPTEIPVLIIGLVVVIVIVVLVVVVLLAVVAGWVCYCSRRRGFMEINTIPRARSVDYVDKHNRVLHVQTCSAYGQRNATLPVSINDAYAVNELSFTSKPCAAYEINTQVERVEDHVYSELDQPEQTDGLDTIARANQEHLYESIRMYDYVDSIAVDSVEVDRNKWIK